MNGKKKITYEDIARRAGVSVSTVARVANGNTRVDPKICKHVRQATIELGGELQRRKKKNQTLAFILSNREMLHPFHSQILVGAETASTMLGYSMLFLRFRYATTKASSELHLPALLETSQEVPGVILAGTNSPNLFELLARRRLPFVVLGNNVLGEWNPESHDVVWFDDIQGAYDITRFLHGLGHRDVWYVGNGRLSWYARRFEGYRRAREEAGLPVRMSEFDTTDDRQLGYLAAKSILSQNQPISAIFAGGDQSAQGACKALTEKGREVPQDVSVAGFNDTEAAMWHPPLTSVRVFPEQISKRMVELLANRIDQPDLPPQHSMIPTQLIKRESCDHVSSASGTVAGESRTDPPVKENKRSDSRSLVSNRGSQPS